MQQKEFYVLRFHKTDFFEIVTCANDASYINLIIAVL